MGTNGRINAQISTEIDRFVTEFQNIEVCITPESSGEKVFVLVHAPYMLQSIRLIENTHEFNKLKENHQLRLKSVKVARENASDDLKEFLQNRFFQNDGQEKLLASGRAELTKIRSLLQDAVEQKFIPFSRCGSDYRKWLKKYGIGIDCSGFVQQAFQRIIDVINSESNIDKGLRIPFLRCGWVYQSVIKQDSRNEGIFTKIPIPFLGRPGDILVNHHHMRIIIDIQSTDDGVIFEAAESTSESDVPVGQEIEENDIGPRRILIKYLNSDQPISMQYPLKKRMFDEIYVKDNDEKTFVIGRYRALRN